MIQKIREIKKILKDRLKLNYTGEPENFEQHYQIMRDHIRVSEYIDSKFADTDCDLLRSLKEEISDLENNDVLNGFEKNIHT